MSRVNSVCVMLLHIVLWDLFLVDDSSCLIETYNLRHYITPTRVHYMAGRFLESIGEFNSDAEWSIVVFGAHGYFLPSEWHSSRSPASVILSVVGETTYTCTLHDFLKTLCSLTLPCRFKNVKPVDNFTYTSFRTRAMHLSFWRDFTFIGTLNLQDSQSPNMLLKWDKCMAACCKFPEDKLDKSIQDHFVCGLNNEATQQ